MPRSPLPRQATSAHYFALGEWPRAGARPVLGRLGETCEGLGSIPPLSATLSRSLNPMDVNLGDPATGVSQPKPRDVQTRWGGEALMLSRGFVGVPVLFLETFAALTPYRLNPAEAVFVISLMAHKWDERAPFPGYKRIAKWMGKSESYARKLARDLETKGLLRRVERSGYTNEFDLSPLFAAVIAHAKGAGTPAKRQRLVARGRTRTLRPNSSPTKPAVAPPRRARARG
jgi:hypothetical protein